MASNTNASFGMADLHAYLSDDHDRLDELLGNALRPDGSVDMESYGAFRAGILRHIGIEERILFPEIRRSGGDASVVEQLHRDHAAISALLVPPPTAREIATIRQILTAHNPLEEERGGLYEAVEGLAQRDLKQLVKRVRDFPEPPLSPNVDTRVVRSSIEQLVREAMASRR